MYYLYGVCRDDSPQKLKNKVTSISLEIIIHGSNYYYFKDAFAALLSISIATNQALTSYISPRFMHSVVRNIF